MIQNGIFALFMKIRAYIFLLVCFSLNPLFAQKRKNEVHNLTSAQSEELMVEGMRHYIKDDFDEAILVWEHLILEVPNEPSIYYYLGKAYLAQNKNSLAFQNAAEAWKLSPHSMDYGLFYVDIALDLRKIDEALEALHKMSEFDEIQPEIGLRLAQAYLWKENGKEALNSLKKVEVWLEDFPEIVRTKQFIYLKEKDVLGAMNAGLSLIENSPDELLFTWDQMETVWDLVKGKALQVEIHALKSRYSSQGQLNLMSAKLFLEAKNLDSTSVEILRAAADVRMSSEVLGQLTIQILELIQTKEDWQTAYNMIVELKELYPLDPRFSALEGDLWANVSKFKEAQIAYLKAARMGNAKFEVWARIIQLDYEMNLLDSATIHAEEALVLFPNQGYLWFQKGFSEYLNGKMSESLRSFEGAVPMANSRDGWYTQLYGLMGDAYHAQGLYNQSDACFEKVLNVNPMEEHVLNNYSYYLSLRRDHLDKAALMSKKLVDKFPANGTYLDTYAWVLFQRGEYLESLMYLEKALQVEKQNSSTVWEHYGDVLFKNGRVDEAVKAWKTANSLEGASNKLDKKIENKRIIEN
jgi:tetratricopeptide (TPR) repeat protein